MDASATDALKYHLQNAGIDAGAIARAGGGIWCFGSRAASCAMPGSDWDVLLLTNSRIAQQRRRHAGLDLVEVGLVDAMSWATSELAAHVAAYGVRIDDGPPILLTSFPVAAAPRKRALVAARAAVVERLWPALQPAQRRRATLRLRHDIQRAWLLSRNAAIPPTALLERDWLASTPRSRTAILSAAPLSARIERAIRDLDESPRGMRSRRPTSR